MTLPGNAWSLCLWREARGEGREGMRAVAWVIQNRSKAWAKSIMQVLMAPNQFTSMVERPQIGGVYEFEFPPDTDAQWEDAKQIVTDLITGKDTTDPTHGALYYANLATATSGWFFRNVVESPEHPESVRIGHHTFYR